MGKRVQLGMLSVQLTGKLTQLDAFFYHLYRKVDTEVDTKGFLSGKRMFQHSKGQTRVNVTLVIVINGLSSHLLHYNSRSPLKSPPTSTTMYKLFDVKGKLEVVISFHCSSENVVIELYVEFVEADGSDPSSTTIAANIGSDEGTSNLLVKVDNEDAYEEKGVNEKEDTAKEEDVGEEKGVADVVDRSESDLDPIQ
ncbi:hypothetical protein J1N35_007400 [Gossypium stocksii]|uniref:Uncharacterized protein n=1 Tax=Gossypium stocksii TaxID=47602 RepID=A0A9D3W6Y7_9ROSI|nr:hypothetical protein J1N35_007400 [Gossypium stocksii]